MALSIEKALLRHAEITTGCTKELVFPAPENCDATVQFLSKAAEWHLFTWGIILFLLFMIFSATLAILRWNN